MNGNREKIFHILLKKAKQSKSSTFWSKLVHIYCLYILGFEFESRTSVGNNFSIVHGARGSVINSSVIIGNDCILRNNTIIGNNGFGGGAPILGDNVNIGANSCIIGNIHIGNNVIIGAGSVVVKDVLDNVVIVGNPARIIKTIK